MAVIVDNGGRLRHVIFAGDRIRLKADKAIAYRGAYRFNVDEIRTVTRVDDGAGSRRLVVEGAPHMFWPADVELAWNSPAERREALLKAGHTT